MSAAATIEDRLTRVETELAILKEVVLTPTRKPDWLQKIAGSFKGDRDFGEILRLGREFRQADAPSSNNPKVD